MLRTLQLSILVLGICTIAGCSSSEAENPPAASQPSAEPVVAQPAVEPTAVRPAVKPEASATVDPEGPVAAAVAPALGDPVADPDEDTAESGTDTPEDEDADQETGHVHDTNPKHRRGKDAPFDPIKENGPIFVDWPTPRLALVITGRQEGYIEPCGCAGLDRMKGGMSRRHGLFRDLEKRGWPVVAIDVGGIARGFGHQAERKFHIMVDGMRKMGYDAIALGRTDLRLPAGELVADAASLDGHPSPFVATNVALFGFDAELTARTRIVERAGLKLGIAAVLGENYQKSLSNPDVEMIPPEEAIEAVLPQLKEQAQVLVLLAHADMDETLALAKRFPEFRLVVTAGGPPEPPSKPARVEGSGALLVEVGEKGMDAVVVGIFDDPEQPTRYQRVPLDSRFPGTAEMKALLVAYQEELKRAGWSGLGLRSLPHPQSELNGRFVGSKACKDCHEESYDIWKKTGHAKAYETLVELDPPRQFDPECISCHVIGWNPQKYYPYDGGYTSLEETPHLIDVGCESCHGPGGAHVAAESGSDEQLQIKLQEAMVITKEESRQRQCFTCHDGDNSPDFDFDTYWPDVEHYEDY